MKNEQLKNYKIFEDLDDDQLNKFHPIIEKEKTSYHETKPAAKEIGRRERGGGRR